MPISVERARRHIRENCEALRLFHQNKHWPRYLYHTAQVEVTAEILRTSRLVPRRHQHTLIHDVANQGAITNNPDAHRFIRLYFRPKNSFHFKTEGIKAADDLHRQSKHMSIPIMLAFDAQSLLTLDGVGFTPGNFAVRYTTPEFSEAAFDKFPFDYVYHDRPPPRESIKTVHYHRMAEVVYEGELPIEPHLKYIVCRSIYDKTSLLSFLGDSGAHYAAMIVVEQVRGAAFMHRAMYLTGLQFTEDGRIAIRVTPPLKLPQSN